MGNQINRFGDQNVVDEDMEKGFNKKIIMGPKKEMGARSRFFTQVNNSTIIGKKLSYFFFSSELVLPN